jgi:hypothetical protein
MKGTIHMLKFRLRAGRIAAAGAGGIALVLLAATPALADTSASTASALQINLVGGGVASSGQTTASNDGTTETQTGTQFPAISVLGSQNVITSGVLAQVARAFNNGTSAACAGVLGQGGTLTVGTNGVCTVTTGSQVTLTLGVVGLSTISLVADAIYGYCSATSTPTTSGAATLTNASIVSTTGGVPVTLLSLPNNPSPNTGFNLPGILSLQLNAQSSSTPGQLAVSALKLTALNAALVGLDVGAVTCGPNAIAPPVPAIPLAGAPIAAGLVAIFGAGAFLWRRRRLAMVQD